MAHSTGLLPSNLNYRDPTGEAMEESIISEDEPAPHNTPQEDSPNEPLTNGNGMQFPPHPIPDQMHVESESSNSSYSPPSFNSHSSFEANDQ